MKYAKIEEFTRIARVVEDIKKVQVGSRSYKTGLHGCKIGDCSLSQHMTQDEAGMVSEKIMAVLFGVAEELTRKAEKGIQTVTLVTDDETRKIQIVKEEEVN